MSRQEATAKAVLQRLLVILPAACREGGVPLDQLAENLGVDPARIVRDLKEVEGRAYYLPPGQGDRIRVEITSDRVEIVTTGEFQRPVRLTPRETLALELGLRAIAPAAAGEERGRFDRLKERLRHSLIERLRAPDSPPDDPIPLALGGLAGNDPIYGPVERALREHRRIRLNYRAAGRPPGERTAIPRLLVHAQGRWYLLSIDDESGEARAFRLDRILSVELREEVAIDPMWEEEIERAIGEGRVFSGGAELTARVRYSARIARWVREHGWAETRDEADGSVTVTHQVADPEWLLGHVLGYGPDARILEPEWMAERVLEAVAPVTDP